MFRAIRIKFNSSNPNQSFITDSNNYWFKARYTVKMCTHSKYNHI